MSGGIAFAMHVIVVRLFERSRQIGQFPVGRIHDHGLSARLVIERLLSFDVECRHDGGVAPDTLQVRMPVGLPWRFELRGLPERCQRNQNRENLIKSGRHNFNSRLENHPILGSWSGQPISD